MTRGLRLSIVLGLSVCAAGISQAAAMELAADGIARVEVYLAHGAPRPSPTGTFPWATSRAFLRRAAG